MRRLARTHVHICLSGCLVVGLAGCGAFGLVSSEQHGLWQSDGYGVVLDVGAQKVELIERTSISCVLSEEGYNLEHLFDEALDIDMPTPDELIIRFTGGQQVYRYERVSPEDRTKLCPKALPADPADPVLNFEIFWRTFDEHYAFFDVRSVDWQATYDEHRPTIDANSSNDDLVAVLANMVGPLRDGHVSIEFEGEDPDLFQYALERQLIEECQRTAPPCADPEAFVDDAYDRALDIITDSYLDGNADFALDEELFWGALTPDVGYLYIGALDEYSYEDTAETNLALLEPVLDHALSDLSAHEGLVIDLRFNVGGYDLVGLAIAERFADRRRRVLDKRAHAQDPTAPSQAFYIEPSEHKNFDGEIVVLIGPDTVSAAEILTLALRTLPNVQLIGEPTEGILSDELYRTLPIGVEFSLSNEIYKAADGEIYESRGIPPDIAAPFMPEADRRDNVDSMLEKALDLLDPRLPDDGSSVRAPSFRETARASAHRPS